MQPEESLWKRGGIETTWSTLCLFIANSNISECCGTSAALKSPQREQACTPHLAVLQQHRFMVSAFCYCPSATPAPHPQLCYMGVWLRGEVWRHLEVGTTWYLSLGVEKLIVCIKWLLLSTKFSSHTAIGGQEGDKFSPCKRGQWWDIYTCKHPLLGLHGSTAGFMSAVLQMYS